MNARAWLVIAMAIGCEEPVDEDSSQDSPSGEDTSGEDTSGEDTSGEDTSAEDTGGDDLPLTRISSLSPLAAGCGAAVDATNYPNSEVQPMVAGDPGNPLHLIAVYQQDRWSSMGSNSQLTAVSDDFGATWRPATGPAFTPCAGGSIANGTAFEVATDSWVAISPSGTAFQVAMGIDSTGVFASGMMVSRSTDGGDTWSTPHTVIRDDDERYFDDRPILTADPYQPGVAYLVWDRIDDASTVVEHAWTYLSVTTDDGETWSPARPIFDPGPDMGTVGNQLVVLPDGTLVIGFERVEQEIPDYRSSFALIRSTDGGNTWSEAVTVDQISGDGVTFGLLDPDGGDTNVRNAALPLIGVDPNDGTLHAIWRDNRFTDVHGSSVAYSESADGGLTWSPAVKINQSPEGTSTVIPMIAVSANGRVGVTYFDFRNNDAEATLPTDHWLVTCDADCTNEGSWVETHLAGPFDVRGVPDTSFGLMVGDYTGLASDGDAFVSIFGQGTGDPANPTDLFSVIATP